MISSLLILTTKITKSVRLSTSCGPQCRSQGNKGVCLHATTCLGSLLSKGQGYTSLMKKLCNDLVRSYIQLCSEINFPLAEEKTNWSSQLITFLGMLLNTITQTIHIPIEKRDKALKHLWDLLTSRKTTVLKLQRLAGLLHHLSKALAPARAFNRRYYWKYKGLKQLHHVRVDKEMKLNTEIWIKFLNNDACLARPFIDFEL